MNIAKDWESCIQVGKGWSHRGEDGFKGPEDCIKMLVSCTTGGGNLLLNFGPQQSGSRSGWFPSPICRLAASGDV
jgi:alpha-L-fucosidase